MRRAPVEVVAEEIRGMKAHKKATIFSCDLVSTLWTKERQDASDLGPQLIKQCTRSGS